MTSQKWPALRQLGVTTRLGLVCLVLVLGGGYIAAAIHLMNHYENRDGEQGVSLVDLESAYHGVSTEAPLLRAVEQGHPKEITGTDLPEAAREALLSWLRSDRIAEDYDNFDLGENAPAEVIDVHCLNCHGGDAADGGGIRLEYFQDVQPLAISREIERVPDEILIASMHAHAPVMATIAIVISLLAAGSRWPRPLIGGVVLILGVSLPVDFAAQWLARENKEFVKVLIGAGGTHMVSAAILVVAIVTDLLIPSRRPAGDA